MENKATIFDLHRICRFYNGYCEKCILHIKHNGCCVGCRSKEDVQKINDTILEWCKEHPPKTYKEDFLEKFPNAQIGDENTPVVCRVDIYGGYKCKCKFAIEEICYGCWNTPMED